MCLGAFLCRLLWASWGRYFCPLLLTCCYRKEKKKFIPKRLLVSRQRAISFRTRASDGPLWPDTCWRRERLLANDFSPGSRARHSTGSHSRAFRLPATPLATLRPPELNRTSSFPSLQSSIVLCFPPGRRASKFQLSTPELPVSHQLCQLLTSRRN